MSEELTLDRSLPHSLEAERAVLGAILLDNRLYDQAAELLTDSDFHSEAHRKIFIRMEELSSSARAIDSVTLREALQKENDLEVVGGAAYIASLVDGVPRISNLVQYARIVKEKSILRRLIHSTNEILLRSYAAEDDPLALLEQAEQSIFKISQERVRGGFVSLSDLLKATWENIHTLDERKELVTGVPSGFTDLDEMTSGFQKSDLVILAGRPGMGKTSLALNIGQYAAIREGGTVGLFSLEMSAEQLVMRLLCGEARVDSHKVRSGFLSKADWQDLAKAMSRLAQAKIFIDDTPGISIVEMRSKSRRLMVEHGLDMVIIDYMQLMSAFSGNRQRFESRQQEISAISRALKGLAKELNIPVLALSQLSRAPEQRRGDHRPQLSDLRESGSIEQDADVVLFVFRPDLYAKDDEAEESGVAEIIIGKQRNGPTGVVKLAFIDQWTKFENLAREME
ncbi:MAG: replicative DNA helicase [Acidobacteriota bacterium]|jgi:replicative DNA helicase